MNRRNGDDVSGKSGNAAAGFSSLPARAGSYVRFRIPSPVRAMVAGAGQMVRGCLGGRVPVVRLCGPANPSGRPASVLMAGEEPWVSYLPRRFFLGAPRREPVARVPVFKLPALLRRLRGTADLSVARVDLFSASLPWGRDYLHMPEWIGAALDLPGAHRVRFRRTKSLRDDYRRIRKNRLVPRLSRSEADLSYFYHRMYVPYIRARHGDLGVVCPYHYVRQWFDRGGLLFVERDGAPLAAMLCMRIGRDYHMCADGTLDGRFWPVKLGALAALTIYGYQHACKTGCARLTLGGSRPVLQDGVLRYKSKWNPRFESGLLSQYRVLLHWNRFDGPVADFFSHTSPVFWGRNGLAGLTAAADGRGAAAAACRKLWVSGLETLFMAGPERPPAGRWRQRVTLLRKETSPRFLNRRILHERS